MPFSNYTAEYPYKTVYSVKNILDFNNGENQKGQGLKILTPQQMLSRLPITLAQLKSGNNSQNLKMKSDNYCIPCIDQKSEAKQSINI